MTIRSNEHHDEQHVGNYGPVTTVKPGASELSRDITEEFSVEPCCMVIFGGSGDLASKKLIPSLYRLYRHKLLPNGFFIIGASKTEYTDETYRQAMEKFVKEEHDYVEETWRKFTANLYYRSIDFSINETFADLKKLLHDKNERNKTHGNVLYYFSTPPSTYATIAEAIALNGLSDGLKGWRRLVIEKPFGVDLQSARDLNKSLYRHFNEPDIYRIDHYLGKDTVQNIFMLRFANSIFEPIWNRRYIDHIQITVSETIGIEKRAGYYEQAGILRDMFQNHMLQVLSLATMEPPSVFDSELCRDERVKVLRAMKHLQPEHLRDSIVLGQYAGGDIGGKVVKAYIEEDNVPPGSQIPTFAAMKLYIDNWRWQGVPFYFRSGKRMKHRFSQVTIQFKNVPHRMFRETLHGEIGPNALILRLQPDERVQLKFHTKSPGSRMTLRDVVMDFKYTEGYQGLSLDAYERVLLDCMLGDKMLFIRNDGLDLAWSYLTPALEVIDSASELAPEVHLYRAGTNGPAEADVFIQKDGRKWANYQTIMDTV